MMLGMGWLMSSFNAGYLRHSGRQSDGRDAVIERGDLGFSVPPGVTPDFD